MLQVRTEIGEFRQTPRDRGFLLLGYSCLKSHENGFGSCEAGNGWIDEGTVLGKFMAGLGLFWTICNGLLD